MSTFLNFWRNLLELVPEWRAEDVWSAWTGGAAVTSGWTVLMGSLVAVSCGLLGCYLIVQGLSLIGDAISHTVLLGMVVAFLLTGQVTGLAMFVGAAVAGIATTSLISGLHKTSTVKEDAAIGIVFTSLFALGVVLLDRLAHHTHLDSQHMLLGHLETSIARKVDWGPVEIPLVVIQMAGVLLAIVLLISLFYKELLATSFDPQWSQTAGLRPRVFHFGLMAVLSMAVVGSFTAVGAILVVAMLIAPAATAYLLTDRLPVMFGLSALVGILSSLFGFQAAYWLDCSTGGAMVCVACGLFGLAFLFSPQRGLISVALRQARLRLRTHEENIVRALWHLTQRQLSPSALSPTPDRFPSINQKDLQHAVPLAPLVWRWTCHRLLRRGWVEQITYRDVLTDDVPPSPRTVAYRLTREGAREAQRLDRAHRLWESYLVSQVGLPSDHVHVAAEEVEHLLSEQLIETVDDLLGHPDQDPHGSPIPRSTISDVQPGRFTLSKLRVGDEARLCGLTDTPASPALTTPPAADPDIGQLDLPLAQPFTLLARDQTANTWTIQFITGKQVTIPHPQADRLLVQPLSPPASAPLTPTPLIPAPHTPTPHTPPPHTPPPHP